MNIKNMLPIGLFTLLALLSGSSCLAMKPNTDPTQPTTQRPASKSSSSGSTEEKKGKEKAKSKMTPQEEEIERLKAATDELRGKLDKYAEFNDFVDKRQEEWTKHAANIQDACKTTIDELNDKHQKETTKLKEKLGKHKNARPTQNIQCTYGPESRGPRTDEEESKFFKAQAESLKYNNFYHVMKDVAGGVNTIVAPAISQDLTVLLRDFRQYYYKTKSEQDEEKLKEVTIKSTSANTDLTKAQELHTHVNTYTQWCGMGNPNTTDCIQSRKMIAKLQVAQLQKLHEDTTGEKFPTK